MEQPGIGPDVRAVLRDEQRDVADEADPQFTGAAAKGRLLELEDELLEPHEFRLLAFPGAEGVERGGVPPALRFGPGVPGAAGVEALQDAEEREVVQPRGIRLAEIMKPPAGPHPGGTLECPPEGDLLGSCDERGVDPVGPPVALRGNPPAAHQAVAQEVLEADEHRIAGEGGRVRRESLSRWAHREHLPPPLPRPGEEIEETARGRAEVAHAVAVGE